jgi:hypothetical protein
MCRQSLSRIILAIIGSLVLGTIVSNPTHGQRPDRSGPVLIDLVLDLPNTSEEGDNPTFDLTSREGGASTLQLPTDSTATQSVGKHL